ncbi:hypothetical protein GFK26_12590 [Variovorax paradoxus]|uniref:Uncharacterized protein n=1 Tax=Variovorax paradoxus TaxID=34073 RepID=A0A5Q0M276_VARPD|nr:hypothetical protein [Variovorax paradoxus]QFZ83536.1 hypothetical protein GFK26_12590 [Variovorax paradoxus]
MSIYRKVVVQSYLARGEKSSSTIRARPVDGQGLDVDMHVECSSNMRNGHPVGTFFLITAQVTDRQSGPPFLYTSFRWVYDVLSPAAAQKFIREGGWH